MRHKFEHSSQIAIHLVSEAYNHRRSAIAAGHTKITVNRMSDLFQFGHSESVVADIAAAKHLDADFRK